MNRDNIKWLVVLMVVLKLAWPFSAQADGEKRVGFFLWNDQPRYINNKWGVIDYLKKQGYKEPKVKFVMGNAAGSKPKAVGLARKFGGERLDLLVTVGTTASVIAANEIKDVPIVFVMVWDPVESKIANDWQSSGNNTTGVSSKTPAAKLLRTIKEFAPVKRVAVLYTPGERNSEIQLKEFQAARDASHVEIVPVPLSSKEMIEAVLSDVVTKVEAICLTGSSVVGDRLPTIIDIATKASVITASQSEDHVERGALLGITVDPYAIGHLAGEKVIRILKGAKPSSIPIELLNKLELVLNMKTAKAGKFQVPPSFMKSVTKVVE